MKYVVWALLALNMACATVPAPRTTAPVAEDAAVDAGADVAGDDATDAATDAATADLASPEVFDTAAETASAPDTTAALALTSPAFVDGGTLPAEFTCDGTGHSPPLAWSGAPTGTVEYALLMTTQAKDGLKWNWVISGIPASASGLTVGQKGVGQAGLTSDGPLLQYYPPCSQGPGAKFYTFTLYALSAKPTLPAQPNQVTGAVLTEALAPLVLAKSAVTVSYTRPQ